jgi:chromosome segregation ATPase
MSTAGKVLVVLIMVTSLSWMILTAGVTQLNRNGNQALKQLSEKVAQLEEDVRSTQEKIVQVKDQTTVMQEKMDRDLAVINARQNDSQRMASEVREILSRVQYELATVQQTVQNSEQLRTQRAEEKVAEQKALDQAREEVKALKASDRELTDRLTSLRTDFKKTLKSSVDIIGRH